jgi:hypothetical protein
LVVLAKISVGFIVFHTYLELPNTGFFNSKPKKDRFWGLVWKKSTGVVFAVRDTSDVLEWNIAFKKRSESVQNRSEAFWSDKNKRSGMEITVQEFFFS